MYIEYTSRLSSYSRRSRSRVSRSYKFLVVRQIQLGFSRASSVYTMNMNEAVTAPGQTGGAQIAPAEYGEKSVFEEVESASPAQIAPANANEDGEAEAISLSTIMAVFVSLLC